MDRSRKDLGGIRAASLCSVRWSEMEGDERVRVCGACGFCVHNLEGLDVEEAAALISGSAVEPSPRWYRRSDGTLLTRDCPVGVCNVGRRRLLALAGSLAVLGLSLPFILSKKPRLPAGAATVPESV